MAVKFRINIGKKLAVGSLAGIVLLGALVGSTFYSITGIENAVDGLVASFSTVDRMADSKRSLVEMRAQYRDALTAKDIAGIDSAVAAFKKTTDHLGTLLEKSEAAATEPEMKANMTHARDLLVKYIAGWTKAVEAHRGAMTARLQALDASTRMYQTLEVLQVQLKKIGDNSLALPIERASSSFFQAGGKIWRILLTADASQLDSVKKAVEFSIAQLSGAIVHPDPTVSKLGKAAIDTMRELGSIAELAATSVTLRDTTAAATVPSRDETNAIADAALARTFEISDEHHQRADDAIGSAELTTAVFSALAVLTMLLTTLFGTLSVARPIGRIAGVLEALSEGNRRVDVPYVNRSDEVGDAARAAGVFKESLVRLDTLDAERREADARLEAEKREAMQHLADSFENAVGGIVEAVSSAAAQLQAAAGTMSESAEMTTRQTSAVATASEAASTNVETVATAAEELAASVGEIGRRVNESAKIAGDAARDADTTATKVARLSVAAQKIGDIVGLITNVASQTNLLALNATIEAARAGEAGKGFAVVASEVKNLADQTAKATAEIARQIEEIQTSTADSTSAIGAITETIRKMNEISSTIASAVEQQGAATQEIASNVQRASMGTHEVSDNIGGVTRAAADASTAAGEVLHAASDLATQSSRLREELGSFLARVRAA